MKVLVTFKCVSKIWSTLIGNPHSISTSEAAAFTVLPQYNCLITRPGIQYHHLVTRSSSSSNSTDPIFPTMRELHLMKAVPFAGKKKIVRCGSSIRIFSPKLKLVRYGSLIHNRIPSAKLKLVEFCILRPIPILHVAQGEVIKKPKWVFTSKDVVFFKHRLFEVLWICMAIWGANKFTFMAGVALGIEGLYGSFRGEWWE